MIEANLIERVKTKNFLILSADDDTELQINTGDEGFDSSLFRKDCRILIDPESELNSGDLINPEDAEVYVEAKK